MKEPITLTGCVEAGTAPDTFVLTRVVRSDTTAASSARSPIPPPSISNPTATPPITTPPAEPPAPGATQPTPTATSGTEASANAAVYALDSPEKVKPHVGHKISVTGTLDDDMGMPKEGTTATTDTKVAASGDKQASHKVKVKSIKMISSSCS